VAVGAYAAVVAALRAVAAGDGTGDGQLRRLPRAFGQLTGSPDAWSYAMPILFAVTLGEAYRHLRRS